MAAFLLRLFAATIGATALALVLAVTLVSAAADAPPRLVMLVMAQTFADALPYAVPVVVAGLAPFPMTGVLALAFVCAFALHDWRAAR